jgi:hypothetical protein
MRIRSMAENNPKEEPANQEIEQPEGSGEYGIERMLIQDEADLSKAQEEGMYHYSQKELEHQADPIDEPEKSA